MPVYVVSGLERQLVDNVVFSFSNGNQFVSLQVPDILEPCSIRFSSRSSFYSRVDRVLW